MLSGHEGLFSLDSHSDKRLEGPWLPVCCQPGLTCPRDAGLALAPSSQRARQEIMIINGRPLFLVLDNKGQAGEMVGGWRKGKKKQEVVGEGKEMGPLVELCVEPAGLCGRCTGVAVPLRRGTQEAVESQRGTWPSLGEHAASQRW